MSGDRTRPLSRRSLAAYAAPAAPLGMLYFPVYVYLPPLYAARGLDLATLGAILLGARLLDAVTDPAMGALSDRLPSRWGRRKPWLAVSALPILIAAWALFLPPAAPSAAWFGLWLTALTLGWTMAMTPYYAWGAELHGDYAERVRAASWRESAGLVGAVLAAGLYAAAAGGAPAPAAAPGADPAAGAGAADGAAGLALVFAALAVLLPLGVAAATLVAPEPPDLSRRRLPLRGALGDVLRAPGFRRLLPAHFVNGLANGLPAALFLFYTEHVIGRPDLAGPLLALYFLAAVAGAPLWTRLARRYEKPAIWRAAMVYACAVFACALALGEGDAWPFAAIALLSGLALGADLALPAAMLADVAEGDAAAAGEQRTGLFFAAWSVASKAALAVSGGAALWALDGAGFAASGANDARALWALALLYAGAPVALKLLAVALMRGYRLSRAAQAAARARLEDGAAGA
ncbi:MFS transporter [Rhodovulum sp. DZ06]|uniref:MFS transporter n=1 Tax=Rhodovulum sp. DZ06 TaxID=3425126 RepID=UPI003D32B752